MVKLFLNIVYLSFTNCEFMEISYPKNEDFWEKFHNDQMLKGQDISELKITDPIHFILETWDYHLSVRQKYNQLPKYQFIFHKELRPIVQEDDTILLRHSQWAIINQLVFSVVWQIQNRIFLVICDHWWVNFKVLCLCGPSLEYAYMLSLWVTDKGEVLYTMVQVLQETSTELQEDYFAHIQRLNTQYLFCEKLILVRLHYYVWAF